jgi:ubiquinone/menaquinone biosynthesis C-methylase UbiE
VLDTFSLCVLGDAAPAALAEMARVLRPNGCAPFFRSFLAHFARSFRAFFPPRRRVLLLEHSRASFAALGAYQDATSSLVAASGKGCAWNQDVLAMLPAAGLRVTATTPALGGLLRTIEAVRA